MHNLSTTVVCRPAFGARPWRRLVWACVCACFWAGTLNVQAQHEQEAVTLPARDTLRAVCTSSVRAQQSPRIFPQRLADAKGPLLAVKTNLLYWATTTPNLGAEVRLARHFTLEAEVGLNPFKHKHDDGSYGRSFRHLRVHPELRYWFCEAFYKHFIGLHVPYVNYNISDIKLLNTEDKRKQGWGAGLGLSYGYDWALSRHWNLEGTIGGGWLRLNHKVYPCANCGTVRAHEKKNYFGLTQAGVTLSYLF